MATAEYMRGYRAGKLAYERAQHPKKVRRDPSRKENPRGLRLARKAATGGYKRRFDKCVKACTCCAARKLHTCPYGGTGAQMRCLGCGNWN